MAWIFVVSPARDRPMACPPFFSGLRHCADVPGQSCCRSSCIHYRDLLPDNERSFQLQHFRTSGAGDHVRFSSLQNEQEGHATECLGGNDTTRLPQTDGCPQLCHRHDLHDREGYPLSAPTAHRVNHSVASVCLPKRWENNQHRETESTTISHQDQRLNSSPACLWRRRLGERKAGLEIRLPPGQ